MCAARKRRALKRSRPASSTPPPPAALSRRPREPAALRVQGRRAHFRVVRVALATRPEPPRDVCTGRRAPATQRAPVRRTRRHQDDRPGRCAREATAHAGGAAAWPPTLPSSPCTPPSLPRLQDPYLEDHRGHLHWRYSLFEEALGRIEALDGGLDAFTRGWLHFGFNRGTDVRQGRVCGQRRLRPALASAPLPSPSRAPLASGTASGRPARPPRASSATSTAGVSARLRAPGASLGSLPRFCLTWVAAPLSRTGASSR